MFFYIIIILLVFAVIIRAFVFSPDAKKLLLVGIAALLAMAFLIILLPML